MKLRILLLLVFTLFSLNVVAGSYYYYESYGDGHNHSYSTYRYTKTSNGGGKTKIKKCQDKDGKWHYGSNSDYRCADSSKITTLNENGVRVGQVAAVKTQEELDADEQKRKDVKLAEEKAKYERLERERILTVYQTVEDIERAREAKIESLKSKIEQHNNYVQALENREKLLVKKKKETKNGALKIKFNEEIDELKPKAELSLKRVSELQKEEVEVNKKYDDDLAVFKKYKG